MGALRVLITAVLLMVAPVAALAELDTNAKPPEGIQTTTVTLADVMALNTKAVGKRLDEFKSRIEVWNSRLGGMDAVDHTTWSGRDFKQTSTWGPFTGVSGRFAGVRWEQNENGITVIMGGVHP